MRKCTAKSKRSGLRCLKWAVRGRSTCHMHGGSSRGPKTKIGRKNSRLAAFRHGGYTQEAFSIHKESMDLIRKSKRFLESIKD